MINRLKEIGYGLISIGKGHEVTLKNLFRKKVTIQYPEVRAKMSPRYRGRLDFNADVCIACGICVKSCPSNVITLEAGPAVPGRKGKVPVKYTADLTHCMFCGFCVEACPTQALRMSPDYEFAGRSRDIMIFDIDRLKREHVARYGETPEPTEEIPAAEKPKSAETSKSEENGLTADVR